MVVDMNRVIQESNAGRSIQKQIEEHAKALQADVQKIEDELKGKDAELRRQRTILSQQAFEEQRQAVERRVNEAQRTVQEKQGALQKAQNDAVGVLLDNAREIISTLAAEKKAQLVLSRQQILLLANNDLETTNIVVERLNAKLPNVTVTVPTTAAALAAPAPAAPAAAAAKPPAKK
jgi:Skp family chaperone for outer membrane proteins